MLNEFFQLILSLKDDKSKLDYGVCRDVDFQFDGSTIHQFTFKDKNLDKKSESELNTYISQKPIKLILSNLSDEQKQLFTDFLTKDNNTSKMFWQLITVFGLRKNTGNIKPEFQEEYDRIINENKYRLKAHENTCCLIRKRIEDIIDEYDGCELNILEFKVKKPDSIPIPEEFYEIIDIPDHVQILLDSRSELYQKLKDENFFDDVKLREQVLSDELYNKFFLHQC